MRLRTVHSMYCCVCFVNPYTRRANNFKLIEARSYSYSLGRRVKKSDGGVSKVFYKYS